MDASPSTPIAVPTAVRAGKGARRTARVVLAAGVTVVLPFFVLVRSGTHLVTRGASPWAALFASLGFTALVLTLSASAAVWWITGRIRPGIALRWFALPAVLLYGAYSLTYLSTEHAKDAEVRAYHRSLHPVLRTALASVILADADLVVTATGRAPDDYRAMGLPTQAASPHYRQRDGFVHAVDLRTRGRAAWRSAALALLFRIGGFEVLRHGGTGDHLHVTLPGP